MSNFYGAFTLESDETLHADGTVTRPLGDHPVGLFSFHESGYFAVQLGPREPGDGAAYFASFGTAEMPPGEEGVILLKMVHGANPAIAGTEHIRNFTFMDSGLLRMRPPVTPEGAQRTIMWRRTSK